EAGGLRERRDLLTEVHRRALRDGDARRADVDAGLVGDAHQGRRRAVRRREGRRRAAAVDYLLAGAARDRGAVPLRDAERVGAERVRLRREVEADLRDVRADEAAARGAEHQETELQRG